MGCAVSEVYPEPDDIHCQASSVLNEVQWFCDRSGYTDQHYLGLCARLLGVSELTEVQDIPFASRERVIVVEDGESRSIGHPFVDRGVAMEILCKWIMVDLHARLSFIFDSPSLIFLALRHHGTPKAIIQAMFLDNRNFLGS